MSRTALLVVLGTIVLGTAGFAAAADAVGRAGGQQAAPTDSPRWSEAECVFVGKLDRATAGPVAQSMPPIYTYRLDFAVESWLRGEIKSEGPLSCNYAARQVEPPKLHEGQRYVVAGSVVRNQLRVETLQATDEALLQQVRTACQLPLGWKVEDGKPVSPWAALGAKAWPANAALRGAATCSKTGRPALLAGGDVTLTVEAVPPAKEIKWTNPDGDGEYKITVTNATDKPVVVPALLRAGPQILWEECLVILCQKKTYVCPGCKGIAGPVEPVTLKPGEAVSTVVNALRLDGPEWPRGGYRIEFRFCLGEKCQSMSFYYMSRHHDAIRAGLHK